MTILLYKILVVIFGTVLDIYEGVLFVWGILKLLSFSQFYIINLNWKCYYRSRHLGWKGINRWVASRVPWRRHVIWQLVNTIISWSRGDWTDQIIPESTIFYKRGCEYLKPNWAIGIAIGTALRSRTTRSVLILLVVFSLFISIIIRIFYDCIQSVILWKF